MEDQQYPDVDPQAIRTTLGFETTAPLILFAGRLAGQKRVDDLLKALDLLQYVQPDAAHSNRRRRAAARLP